VNYEFELTVRTFWTEVAMSLLNESIRRVFITSVFPLSLSGDVSGFNCVTRDLSFDHDVAGLCGLTSSDIQAALKKVCSVDSEAYHQHLSAMTEYFNGYHFCNYRQVDTLYNTEKCLGYLQVRTEFLQQVLIFR
jgi:hypothetical protein